MTLLFDIVIGRDDIVICCDDIVIGRDDIVIGRDDIVTFTVISSDQRESRNLFKET